MRLEYGGTAGPNRQVILLSISIDGQQNPLEKSETVDLFSSDARTKFTDALCKQYPALEHHRQDIIARLDVLSADVVREKMERKRTGGKKKSEGKALQGQEMLFEEVEPWVEPVGIGLLLTEIKELLQRFMVMEEASILACTLWILFSWVLDVFDVAPMMGVSSPSKRCGKSRLGTILSLIVSRPIITVGISEAALFRTIDESCPTLIIDETDAGFDSNEGLRAIVDAGHTRSTASVIRCVGDDHKPRRFSTWCPKVLIGIGRRRGTIEDRSISIRLQRKLRGEKRDRLRSERLRAELLPLRQRLARFAADHADELRDAEPQVPRALNDRAAENLEPLLAIADLAGGDWGRRARDAALQLAGAERDPDDAGCLLLEHIDRHLREGMLKPVQSADGARYLTTEHLLEVLVEDPTWAEWKRGQPLSAKSLAALLGRFELQPERPTIEAKKARGFALDPLQEAIERYVRPATSPSDSPPSGQAASALAAKGLRQSSCGPSNPAESEVARASSCPPRARPHGHMQGEEEAQDDDPAVSETLTETGGDVSEPSSAPRWQRSPVTWAEEDWEAELLFETEAIAAGGVPRALAADRARLRINGSRRDLGLAALPEASGSQGGAA
jgi:hypothetical protein